MDPSRITSISVKEESLPPSVPSPFEWSVVGSGPSGIATVGKLIDNKVNPKDIVWIDPNFTVGDFGSVWRGVPSNTRVDLFVGFLKGSEAFEYKKCPNSDLNTLNSEDTCTLSHVVGPLQWVTETLRTKVTSVKDTVKSLSFQNDVWNIAVTECVLRSINVVLAIGSVPKALSLPLPIIPLQDAMNADRIRSHFSTDDTIAVFGSSHSAVLALRYLIEGGAKRVINFYRTPFVFAVYSETNILFDDSGLKGTTADWAHRELDGNLPKNLERVYSSDENIQKYLSECTKVIYAIGFEKREIPISPKIEFEKKHSNGKIGTNLFGIGIAYPEPRVNHVGQIEYRVGLWKFLDYLERVVPIWLNSKEESNQ